MFSLFSVQKAAGPPERAELQTKVGERTRLHERALVGSRSSAVSFTWPAMRLHIILAPWLTRFVWNACVRAQTVPDLKELCAQAGLPKTGKKQDLIDRLARHPGGGFDGGGGFDTQQPPPQQQQQPPQQQQQQPQPRRRRRRQQPQQQQSPAGSR